MRAVRLAVFRLLIPSFLLLPSFAGAMEFDDDVDPAVRTQFERDLEAVRGIDGRTPTPLFKEVFGDMTGENLLRWFEGHVGAVGKNLCMEDNAVACVLPAWENKIWLSPNYSRFQHPQIARIMVLFHEARHTEASERNWPHAKCPKDFRDAQGQEIRSIWTGASLAGERACDLTETGSYGIATILLLNVAKHCETCSEKMKMDASIYGRDQLKRITWSPARERMEQDLKP